ncbi:hypothetical protein GCM10027360_67170 [Amycolatopsis echigonensis]
MASTAARIGEVSGVRVCDIDREKWLWTVRRQTTTAPGGLMDKAAKGKRAREVPLIEEIRPLVASEPTGCGRPRADGEAVHRSSRRSDQHRGPARRDALGRGRDQAGV